MSRPPTTRLPTPAPALRSKVGGMIGELTLIGTVGLVALTSFAGQTVLPEAIVTRSVSGQFIIHDQRADGASEIAAQVDSNAQFIAFDPTVLAVSCERLKQALFKELGIQQNGQAKVRIVLRSSKTLTENIAITREYFRDGWQYRIDLPDATERTRYVRALVQVLLLEFANRSASGRSAELPTWLVEGLSQELLASDGLKIILAPPRKNVNGVILTSTVINTRRENPLDYARMRLRARPLLTFEDLSWPNEAGWTQESEEIYRLSSQILVHDLMELEDGRARLRSMLTKLPERYNWQLAFLGAFKSDFKTILDVEKWWTLHLLHFTARDPAQTWPINESWRKLEQTLTESAEIRGTTNELPVRTETTLQTVVTGWDRSVQTKALQAKVHELELLRPSLAPAVAPLAEGYEQALKSYLKQSQNSRSLFTLRKKTAYHQAQQTMLERLNQLDSQFSSMKPHAEPLAASRKTQLEPLP